MQVIYRRAHQRLDGGEGRRGQAVNGEEDDDEAGGPEAGGGEDGSFYGLLWNKVTPGFERPPTA
jgi:hypothetical protein